MATSILNLANCGNTANTAANGCDNIPGKPQYVAAIPKGFVIPATQLTSVAAFTTALMAYFQEADSRAARFWLSPLLTNMENTGGDAVTENRDNYEFTVQYKPYNWTYLMNGSFCDYRNWATLVQFNQAKYDFIVFDDRGQVWTRPALDDTGANGAGGFAMAEVSVPNWIPTMKGTELAKYPFRMQFLNNNQIVNMDIIGAGIFPDQSTWGVLSATLTLGATTNTATHYYVKGTVGCGASSLGLTYGDTLAAAGAWVLRNITDGTAITPSAVSYDADTDEYDFTVTAATATDVIHISLAAPSVLTGTPYFLIPAPITETALSFASV